MVKGLTHIATRFFAARSSRALQFDTFGDPTKVLRAVDRPISAPQAGEVVVEVIAAPVHPSDLSRVEATYPILPKNLPAVGGSEGVVRVLQAPGGGKLKEGDICVVSRPDLVASSSSGTWQQTATLPAAALYTSPTIRSLDPADASCLVINPLTAHRLLNTIVNLNKGDVVLQNGGSSQVAQTFVQLAALKGIHTVTVLRQRANYDHLAERIKQTGSNTKTGAKAFVVDENYVRSGNFKKLLSDLPPAKLALNGSGGSLATEIARALGDNGVLVTYGGMSHRPVTIPSSLYIFKGLVSRGFWLTRSESNAAKNESDIDILADLVKSGNLKLWTHKHDFDRYEDAIKAASSPLGEGRKVVLFLKK